MISSRGTADFAARAGFSTFSAHFSRSPLLSFSSLLTCNAVMSSDISRPNRNARSVTRFQVSIGMITTGGRSFPVCNFYRLIHFPRDALVMTPDFPKQPDQSRPHDQRNPRALHKFRHHDDDQSDAGAGRTKRIEN